MSNGGLDLVVNAANLISGVGGLLLVGVFVLSHTTARTGPLAVSVDGLVVGGLLFALVEPFVVIAGFGPYILHANTRYYASPDDYRNGVAFVNTCWFFIEVVAPAFSLLGFGLLTVAVIRSRRDRRPRQ